MMVRINKKADLEYVYRLTLNNKLFKNIIIVSTDPKVTFSQFKSKFEYIKAAGGIVKNNKGKILFIYRKNKWDLPKGKVEEGEKRKIAAKREVMEETGLKFLNVMDLFEETYHIGRVKGKYILKKTSWYEMECLDCKNLIPQTKEGITQIKWVDISKETKILNSTYNNLQEILKRLINLNSG